MRARTIHPLRVLVLLACMDLLLSLALDFDGDAAALRKLLDANPPRVRFPHKLTSVTEPWVFHGKSVFEGCEDQVLNGETLCHGGAGRFEVCKGNAAALYEHTWRLTIHRSVHELMINVGGVAVQSMSMSQASFSDCELQGHGVGPARCSRAVFSTEQSSFQRCKIRNSLFAILGTDSAKISVNESRIENVSYALGTDQNTSILVENSVIRGVKLGICISGELRQASTLRIASSTLDGPLWFGHGRPLHLDLDHNNSIFIPSYESSMQCYKNRKGPHELLPPPTPENEQPGEAPGSMFDPPPRLKDIRGATFFPRAGSAAVLPMTAWEQLRSDRWDTGAVIGRTDGKGLQEQCGGGDREWLYHQQDQKAMPPTKVVNGPTNSSAGNSRSAEPSQEINEDLLLVTAWLKVQGSPSGDVLPVFSTLVEKICKFPLKTVQTNWLTRTGAIRHRAFDVLKHDLNLICQDLMEKNSRCGPVGDAIRRQFFADNMGFFFIIKSPTPEYAGTYIRLRQFIHNSKPIYKKELLPVLYPVLVYLTLELIEYDLDGTKVAAAHALLDLAKDDHYEQHREQYLHLRGLFKWDHVCQSRIFKEYYTPGVQSEVGRACGGLMCYHAKEECRKHLVNIFMRMFYLRMNVLVKGDDALHSDLEKPNHWSPDQYLESTFLPLFPKSQSGASGSATDGKGKAIKDLPSWDEVITKLSLLHPPLLH
ncbi:hypothetical protein GUITHDRAFT_144971 [Guillardia theta CCMP2712]|uniref:TFIID subunit TAF5 NTD2 domain-containing protein n=1 Tax=Guillardia theta (strain CCMP2712) TaxID=905079 RepID=L1IP13_GUITC|nr:hypothetical protein GUITHDRAFT_144971 [Guillardia theta CCMP2712]EKX37560.1 hypothetical protein GUITHDRAFT_144971 [Guillardia theta CCMP2712]|eukprot:XP_005824540.1 hypothetical protein GUITHDRAFT_144971 [Guillardia theta CCMP2712]